VDDKKNAGLPEIGADPDVGERDQSRVKNPRILDLAAHDGLSENAPDF
jgi:hypothetical protein